MAYNIFDTHSHYDDDKFDKDRASLLNSLPDKGVCRVVSCGCDINSSKFNRLLSEKYDYFYFAAGFHPENLEGFTLDDLGIIEEIAKHKKCVAIGEIGLDYHWMSSSREVQKEFFEAQIELAKKLDMPVIVHDREAHGADRQEDGGSHFSGQDWKMPAGRESGPSETNGVPLHRRRLALL